MSDKNIGEQTDSASGETYNKNAVNSDRGPNPNVPYFVGFNQLTDLGIPTSDMIYIKDAITNDVLYRQNQVYAKVSYEKDSMKPATIDGLKTIYSFSYKTNNLPTCIVSVSTDISDSMIDVSIYENNKEVFKRSVTENTLGT